MKIVILFILTSFIFNSTIYASSCTILRRDLTFIHFEKHYYGDEVKKVVAHVGAIRRGSINLDDNLWRLSNKIELTFNEDHFFGKIDLSSRGNTYNPVEGLKVGYFITLANGNSAYEESWIPSLKGSDLSTDGRECYESRDHITDNEMSCSGIGEQFDSFKETNNTDKTKTLYITQRNC